SETDLRAGRNFQIIELNGAASEATSIYDARNSLFAAYRKNHRWKSQQWISSGFDERTAQHVRGKTFRRAERQYSAGSLDWLRRLHRSHSPQAGPFSTCMHRADAATVSYTEVAVSSRHATMRYHAGAPCKALKHCIRHILQRQGR